MKRSWQREDAKKGGPALHTDKISSEIAFLSVNCAIPEKRWELSTYIQLEFLGLLFHPWKFWTKQSYSFLKNPAKLYGTYWE